MAPSGEQFSSSGPGHCNSIVLYKVDEGTSEEGKKGFVDFKRIVWHQAFYELCTKVEMLAKVGYNFELPGIKRLFYPAIIILAADYEEQ